MKNIKSIKRIVTLLIVAFIATSAFAAFTITPDAEKGIFTIYDSVKDKELVVDSYVYYKKLGTLLIERLSDGIFRLIDSSTPSTATYVFMNAKAADADFYLTSDRNNFKSSNVIAYNTDLGDKALATISPKAIYATNWTGRALTLFSSSKADAKKIKPDSIVMLTNGTLSLFKSAVEDATNYPIYSKDSITIDLVCPHCGCHFTKNIFI